MPTSQRFKDLKKRLNELRRHMLPVTFSPIGNYSDRQQDRARGYRLLAHAEIEAYIEEVCKDLVFKAIKLWKQNKKVTHVLFSCMASYHSGWNVQDDINHQEIIDFAKARFKARDSITSIIDTLAKQYVGQLNSNHGLRLTDLTNLLLPTSISLTELDNTWLVNMDEFGKSRGECAHNSKYTSLAVDPSNELKRVTDLLVGLEELDIKLHALSEELDK